jgi:hypothetical protein
MHLCLPELRLLSGVGQPALECRSARSRTACRLAPPSCKLSMSTEGTVGRPAYHGSSLGCCGTSCGYLTCTRCKDGDSSTELQEQALGSKQLQILMFSSFALCDNNGCLSVGYRGDTCNFPSLLQKEPWHRFDRTQPFITTTVSELSNVHMCSLVDSKRMMDKGLLPGDTRPNKRQFLEKSQGK